MDQSGKRDWQEPFSEAIAEPKLLNSDNRRKRVDFMSSKSRLILLRLLILLAFSAVSCQKSQPAAVRSDVGDSRAVAEAGSMLVATSEPAVVPDPGGVHLAR